MTSARIERVLDAAAVPTVGDHVAHGGGIALHEARAAAPESVIDILRQATLRGRGGAGFPTAEKWRTVAEHRSEELPSTVVVNAAEGEPGSYKDRTLLLRNPYKVLEGAAVAAHAVGADVVVIATKHSFTDVRERLRIAIEECDRHVAFGIQPRFELVAGPDTYLFGEETALLEVVVGRPSFPRVAPPWRRGVDDPGSSSGATAPMATPSIGDPPAPVLVNNVETLAHVVDILRYGPDWFGEVGSDGQKGTFLCTVTGDVEHSSVVELPVGISLHDAIARGGGPIVGDPMGALGGVSHPLVPAWDFDRCLAYEGDGTIPVGCGSFRVFNRDTDPLAIAAGVARFLAIESCGQCVPCKEDGLAIASELTALVDGAVDPSEIDLTHRRLASRLETVTNGARCALAAQQEAVVSGLLGELGSEMSHDMAMSHDSRTGSGGEPPVTVAPLLAIENGEAIIDERHIDRQPDWEYGSSWDGKYPVEKRADDQDRAMRLDGSSDQST